MMYLIYGVLIVLVTAGGVYGIQYYLEQEKAKEKSEKVQSGARITLKRLRQNLSALQAGNIHWRRIGHGQSITGLTGLAPERRNGTAENVILMLEETPEVSALVEDHDDMVRKLRDAAAELGEAIQGPVKKQYEHDRSPEDGEPVVKKMPQDGWLFILQALVNDGNFEDGLKGKIGTYWSQREDRYFDIMEEHGGETKKHFDDLKNDLEKQETQIQDQLQKLLEQA